MAATFSQLSDQGLRRTAGVVARAFGQTEDDVLMGRHGVLVTREADLLDRGIQIPSERAQLLRVQAQMTSSSDVRQQTFEFGALHQLLATAGADLFDQAGRSTICAFHDQPSRTAVMLADRVPAEQALNVLLHEIVRSIGRKLFDPSRWQQLISRLHAWSKWKDNSRERAIYASASVRAAKALSEGNARYEDELFAYAVEAAIDLGVKPRAQALEHSAEAWLDAVSSSLVQALAALAPGSRETLRASHLVDLSYAMAQLMSPSRAKLIFQHVELKHPELVERLKVLLGSSHSVFISMLEERIKAMRTVVQTVQEWVLWLEDARRSSSSLEQEVAWSGLGPWLASLNAEEHLARDEVLRKLAHSALMMQEGVERQVPSSDAAVERMERSMQLLAQQGFDVLDDEQGRAVLRSRATRGLWLLDRPVPNLTGVPERVAEIIWALMPDVEAGHHRKAFAGVKTRYHRDQLPGGKNYREIELRLPSDALGKGLAYREAGTGRVNVVLTLCVNERTAADGRKVLFVEAVHSQWAADAKAHGIRGLWSEDWRIEGIGHDDVRRPLYAVVDKTGTPISGASSDREELRELIINNPPAQSVPNGPFIKSRFEWTGLAVRRALREACDCGAEVLAFVDGETFSRRSGQRMRFDEVKVRPLDRSASRMEMVMAHAGVHTTMHLLRRDIAKVIEPSLSSDVLGVCASGRTWEGRRVLVNLDAGSAVTHYDTLLPHTVVTTLRGQGIARDLAFALGQRKVCSYSVRRGTDDPGWYVRTDQGLWLRQEGDAFDWVSVCAQATAYEMPLTAQLAAAQATAEQLSLKAIGLNAQIQDLVSMPMPLMCTALAAVDSGALPRERGPGR